MVPRESRGGAGVEYSVGLLDENEVRADVTAKWIEEGIPCVVATSSTDLLTKFDRSWIVVCIREQDNENDSLVQDIWEKSPHTQILILLDRGAFTGLDRTCDDTLHEPYSKTDLQERVSRLFGRGLYDLKLQQYYQLTSYLTGHEEIGGELSEESMERIQEQCAVIEGEIEEITNTFGRIDFEDILLSHNRRERVLGTPAMDPEEETSSKYLPPKCPSCELTWGASHGGRLGKGFERVAAMVWRCRSCREIIRASPGEYDKIL